MRANQWKETDMRVLVCGGRNYDDEALLHRTLTELHLGHPFSVLIEGGARGADLLAREWAEGMAVRVQTFEADWSTYGGSAGPIRNRQALTDGQPDLVVAFPGGRGTADMVGAAERRGVRVMKIGE